MMSKKITIATRQSELALAQANWVKTQLQAHFPAWKIELLAMTTQADKILDKTLSKIGGKGLFVKELEEALYDKRADMAVHSMKDVPMDLPAGLCLPVMCEREDPRDVMVSNHYASLAALPAGAVVGTASIRRTLQIQHLFPHLAIKVLRGNVQTRLKRLDNEEYAAIILAAAGLKRLGLTDRIKAYLPLEHAIPAAGQGALGIECRADDQELISALRVLNHQQTFDEVSAERAVCREIGGGCSIPLAAFAQIKEHVLHLQGFMASLDGKQILQAQSAGAPEQAETIGLAVAEQLIAQGALGIIQSCHEQDALK